MDETRRLTEFVAKASYGGLPNDVIERAKVLILDYIGCSIFGSQMEWSKMVVDFVRDRSAHGECTVITHDWTTTEPYAALTNAVMGHAFEIDDVNQEGLTHPGTVVIPAALAVAERNHVDGRLFLCSVVMGYEVAVRVGASVGWPHMVRGFHTVGTNGPFGAAAAAGKALGLSYDELLSAIGIVGSMVGGLMEFQRDPTGPPVKRLHAGIAAQNGVTAALLAQKGYRGPATILEGTWGFGKAYSDTFQPEKITEGLGQRFAVITTSIKPYACVGNLHGIIDCLNQLISKYRIKPQEVEQIVIGGTEKLMMQSMIYKPESAMAAQYSVPYQAAATFYRDMRDPKVFIEALNPPGEILSLAQKVTAHVDPEIEGMFPVHFGAKVVIVLKDGRELRASIQDPKGTPPNPLSYGEVCEKFNVLTNDVLPKSQQERIIEAANSLESFRDMSQLGALLRAT